jgi:hypothetical protein
MNDSTHLPCRMSGGRFVDVVDRVDIVDNVDIVDRVDGVCELAAHRETLLPKTKSFALEQDAAMPVRSKMPTSRTPRTPHTQSTKSTSSTKSTQSTPSTGDHHV